LNRIKGLTAIGTTDIVGLAISASFWFILATLIDPEEYGNIFYLLSIAGIISLVAPISTNYVNTVYSAKKINLLTELNIISVSITGIAVIILFLLIQRIDICVLIFGMVLWNLTTGKMLGEKKFKLYAISNIFQKSTTLIFGLIFYFLFGFENIIFALALTYVFHVIVFFRDIEVRKYDFSQIKTKIRFVFANYLNNLTGMIGGQVDKLAIGGMFGFTLLGHYSLAIQVITIMMILPNLITRYLITEDLYNIKNSEFRKRIIILAGVISMFGIVLIPEIIPHVFPKYMEIIEPIRIMSLSVLPATFAKIQISKFLSQERGNIILAGSISYVLILFIGIFTLVNSMGMMGLAISFVLATVSQMMTHTIINKKFPQII
jgi:O-antigen/teichoic acid export membrane protein